MEEIIIEREIKTGKVTVSVNGVPGKACKATTAKIEAAFGKTGHVELTDEYNQRPRQSERESGRESGRDSARERGRG